MEENYPMKRTITLLSALVLLLTLAACGKVTEPDANLDSDRAFSAWSTAQLCEIGDTVYYLIMGQSGKLVYYYDKVSGCIRAIVRQAGVPAYRHELQRVCGYRRDHRFLRWNDLLFCA